VLSLCTGTPESDRVALDFIKACAWLRENCPGCQILAGVTNLSYAFRGCDPLRRALHAVFLKKAFDAGLTLAFANPTKLPDLAAIDPQLREACEDAILARRPDAGERLVAFAKKLRTTRLPPLGGGWVGGTPPPPPPSRGGEQAPEDAIISGLLEGSDENLEPAIRALLETMLPLDILTGPLMEGMRRVGEEFDTGALFLPELMRSAAVMKKAQAILSPLMEAEGAAKTLGKIVIATVKGDVHDIGKNIAGQVLSCNGYEVVDLGVGVDAEQIAEAARTADVVGLSGLVNPSLEEMAHVARVLKEAGISVPLVVSGAAVSATIAERKIAPEYGGVVVYAPDAAGAPSIIHELLKQK
jgi:5-methyltetrahydrofolate--homocysteine methyltransferase